MKLGNVIVGLFLAASGGGGSSAYDLPKTGVRGGTTQKEGELQGSCGNGWVGNGVCADSSLCCSSFGWRGTSAEHCSGSSGGGGSSGGFCKWGPAGTGASSVCEGGAQGGDWCNANHDQCESGCGGKWCTSGGGGSGGGGTSGGTCGSGSVGNGACADSSLCCSEYGWCGTSAVHCNGSGGGGGSGGGSNGAIVLSAADLRPGLDTYEYPVPDPPQSIINAVNDATRDYSLFHQIAFVAQTLWETGGYHAVAEQCATTVPDWCGRNTASDYQGCVPESPSSAAPGALYYGRGLIQLSWCYNYIRYGRERYNQGHNPGKFYDPLQFYSTPDLVVQDPFYTVDAATWFFEKNIINAGINSKFGETTNAINGCLECPIRPGCSGNYVDKARSRFQIFKAIADHVGLTGYSEAGCYN